MISTLVFFKIRFIFCFTQIAIFELDFWSSGLNFSSEEFKYGRGQSIESLNGINRRNPVIEPTSVGLSNLVLVLVLV